MFITFFLYSSHRHSYHAGSVVENFQARCVDNDFSCCLDRVINDLGDDQNRYPGLTIIQYSSQIIGKWPAKCLGCYFIYYWFNFDFIALNQHIQFINTVLFMRTPAIVVSLTLALLCGLAAYMGIESIARSNEYISLLILILLIPLLILMLAESDPERLRPVMSQGMVPVLQGTIFPVAYLGQIIILGWLLPYLNQQIDFSS
ncbi:hypothetical protein QFZ81_000798 [Paenibacillus sp. V4I9]|uniref:GerAB/ArcD/ProY family transporter n=1 Tax=Paenibacillus sp. V4I9 TaxID=3042308 RepID=UPI00278036AD|nr:GerAB/ArcD/ProY family transporter [Paenibacillus sp. V4I9]MDQ0885710.1 hypothetical protein [Paenibacillus sp. V4I9]